MQESRKDKIYQAKLCLWMGFLLAEQGALNLRDNTSGEARYEATSMLKYVQNQIKRIFAFSKHKVSEIGEAEDSLLENVALIKGISETMAMLPPEFVDEFESEYLKFYDGYIKQKISEMEKPTAS